MGPGNADAVIRAQIGIFFQLILYLHAGQDFEVAGTLVERGDQRVTIGIDQSCVHMMSCKVGGGAIEANTGLKTKLPNGNSVLYVACGDALIGVEEGALRLLDAC